MTWHSIIALLNFPLYNKQQLNEVFVWFSTSRKENAESNIYGMTAPHEFANPAAPDETSMKVCWGK